MWPVTCMVPIPFEMINPLKLGILAVEIQPTPVMKYLADTLVPLSN